MAVFASNVDRVFKAAVMLPLLVYDILRLLIFSKVCDDNEVPFYGPLLAPLGFIILSCSLFVIFNFGKLIPATYSSIFRNFILRI